jgi:hypothetical protein
MYEGSTKQHYISLQELDAYSVMQMTTTQVELLIEIWPILLL